MNQESWRTFLRGVWLPAVGVVAYSAASSLAFDFMQRFGLPSDRPGSSPPWYFIRNDYIEGLTMAGVGVLCIVLGLFYLRRQPLFAGMLVWQTVIWFGGPAWKAFVIILRTDRVMDPSSATTDWPTFDAYLAEPLLWYGKMLTLILALVIVVVSTLLERQRVAAARSRPVPVN